MTFGLTRHFTPQSGWLNDPVALVWHAEEYHLFFQARPDTTTWGPECHWGHATSRDLVHWEHQATVLSPDGDEDGCWSGCLVQHDGGATIFYTAARRSHFEAGAIRRAKPTDPSWSRWDKADVVIPGIPLDAAGVTALRDPCILRDGSGWRMVVGAGLEDGRAAAVTFSSEDLQHWRYDGVLAERSTGGGEPESLGSIWECPQLFELDGIWFLVVSVQEGGVNSHVAYAAGELHDGVFTARSWRRLTHDGHCYAPSSFVDADGSRGLIFWLRGVASAEEGWAGAMSLPYLLGRDDDRLVLSVHPLASRPEDVLGVALDGPILERVTEEGLYVDVTEPALESA
jgi:beta-fructofuranosidase